MKKPIEISYYYEGEDLRIWHLKGEPGRKFFIRIGQDDFRTRQFSKVNGTSLVKKKHEIGESPTLLLLVYVDNC